jgi:hypothetical protein
MAQFNLDDYETVASRITRFHEAHPDGRIITENLTNENDRAQGIWIVKTFIYLTVGDQAVNCPKSTGLAFEVDGGGGANRTAALENAETSSIGRALANLGMSGDKKGNAETRPTREEMAKAQRGVGPGKPVQPSQIPAGFEDKVLAAGSMEQLELLWETVVAEGFTDDARAMFSARKKTLTEQGGA